MPILSKTTAKTFFETGDRPSETDFSTTLDSTIFQPSSAGALTTGFVEVVSTAEATAWSSAGSIPVRATGSAATTRRTLGARFAEEFHVEDFGAVFDGTTDNATAFQNAIDAAEEAGGGIVRFSPGTAAISTGLIVDDSNVLLVGAGGDTGHIVGNLLGQSATILKWTGASAATMVTFTTPTGVTAQAKYGGGMIGFSFDSNFTANNGMLIETRRNATFRDLYFNEFDGVCFEVGCVSGLGDSTSSQRNVFDQISTRSAARAAGIGIRLSGNVSGNPSFNYFRNIDIRHEDGVGLECGNSDNNLFETIRVSRSAGGAGIGVELQAGASALVACRANTFLSLFSTGGITARGTPSDTVPSTDNTVWSYDKDNNSPDPVIETDAILYWHATDGVYRQQACAQIAVGESVVQAVTARSQLNANMSVMIVNNNEGHLHLRDAGATQAWKIFLDSATGNLQCNRLTGSGGFTLPGNAAAPLFLTNVEIMQGDGDPEGVIAAPVGSIYLRTDASVASTTLNVKESGTGNTGWVAK